MGTVSRRLRPAAPSGGTHGGYGCVSPHVLVLYSNNRLLPANVEADGGLREAIGDAAELSVEFLDYPRFSGAAFLGAVTAFLREKYAARPPQVLVAGGSEALGYLVRRRGAQLRAPRGRL